MQEIYKNEGKQGLFEALQSGRSEEEYFAMLQDKLGVTKKTLETYIRTKMEELEFLNADELERFRY